MKLFIFSILLLFMLSCQRDDNDKEFRSLCLAVKNKDTSTIREIKNQKEKGWEKEWKLTNFQIISNDIIDISNGSNNIKIIKDSSVLLEWNYNSMGIGRIFQEEFTSNMSGLRQNKLLLYKNDSIFASGSICFIYCDSSLFLYNLEYLDEKINCYPCNKYTISEFYEEQTNFSSLNELWIFDNNRKLVGRYSSNRTIQYNANQNQNHTLNLQSDSIIKISGKCKNVEVNSEVIDLNLPDSALKNAVNYFKYEKRN